MSRVPGTTAAAAGSVEEGDVAGLGAHLEGGGEAGKGEYKAAEFLKEEACVHQMNMRKR